MAPFSTAPTSPTAWFTNCSSTVSSIDSRLSGVVAEWTGRTATWRPARKCRGAAGSGERLGDSGGGRNPPGGRQDTEIGDAQRRQVGHRGLEPDDRVPVTGDDGTQLVHREEHRAHDECDRDGSLPVATYDDQGFAPGLPGKRSGVHRRLLVGMSRNLRSGRRRYLRTHTEFGYMPNSAARRMSSILESTPSLT